MMKAEAHPVDLPADKPAEFVSALSGDSCTLTFIRRLAPLVFLVNHEEFGQTVLKMDISSELNEAMKAQDWSTVANNQARVSFQDRLWIFGVVLHLSLVYKFLARSPQFLGVSGAKSCSSRSDLAAELHKHASRTLL